VTQPGEERKTVVITGATGGVGRGIALACGEAGWRVWIAARREKEGREVAAEVDERGGHGRFVPCDVGDAASAAEAIEAILEADGRLDGVVHNATSGLSPVPVTLAEVSLADFQDHVNVALRALHSLAHASFDALKASQGSLLLMTSEAGFEGKAKLSPYAGVKGAQRGFARALAREWGRDGVRDGPGHGRTDPGPEPPPPARRLDRGHRPGRALPALRRRSLRHRPHADGRRRKLPGRLVRLVRLAV
jgi:3-oxoacyl-[acyl-carrier protein] reductase